MAAEDKKWCPLIVDFPNEERAHTKTVEADERWRGGVGRGRELGVE